MFTGERHREERLFHLHCQNRTRWSHFSSHHLTFAPGAPWWSRVAQPTCKMWNFSRVFGGEGCLAAAAAPPSARERDRPEGVCSPAPAPSARPTSDWTVRWKSRLSSLLSVCVVEASLSVCLSAVPAQAMWMRAFSVSFNRLACSSSDGEWGLLEAAPFSGSGPRLTSVGMELPTGGATCLAARCSGGTDGGKRSRKRFVSFIFMFHLNLPEVKSLGSTLVTFLLVIGGLVFMALRFFSGTMFYCIDCCS